MRKGGNTKAALAVFWSFFGVRRRQDYDADAQSLTPAQVIVAGLIGAAVFVLAMFLLVYLAIRFL
ncbi:MAG: DUF2970 domain-containing protein [Thiobacillus sp.]|nr:DUF2970 domain-containing protein [Thiobacillus sp.]